MADCPTCLKPIAPKAGPGRPATYHPGCKPKRGQSPVGGLASPTVVSIRPAEVPSGSPADPLSLEAATLGELQPVDRHATTQGIAALKLARLLDGGNYNAQGAAALVKSHREALDLALEGTTAEADVIDVIFGASS